MFSPCPCGFTPDPPVILQSYSWALRNQWYLYLKTVSSGNLVFQIIFVKYALLTNDWRFPYCGEARNWLQLFCLSDFVASGTLTFCQIPLPCGLNWTVFFCSGMPVLITTCLVPMWSTAKSILTSPSTSFTPAMCGSSGTWFRATLRRTSNPILLHPDS